jgi:hypothetical protein
MPYTVEASFTSFFDKINLSGDHREIANTRRDDIVGKLGKTFTILESFSTGSIPKYTALKEHADLDVIVVLHYTQHIKHKTPTQVLQDVRNALAEWRTGARRNGQAVTLKYKTWPNVDIVPVSRTTDESGNVLHYNVPNEHNDTWIMSKPKKHAKSIEEQSSSCGYNFRRIVKMMKHWNRIHGDYLQSYHIEALALKVFDGNLDDTSWNVFQFFDKAKPLLEERLWIETGYADDYLDWTDRQQILKRFDTAIGKSRSAWHKTYNPNNDHKGAIEIWKQIFGSYFPSYG